MTGFQTYTRSYTTTNSGIKELTIQLTSLDNQLLNYIENRYGLSKTVSLNLFFYFVIHGCTRESIKMFHHELYELHDNQMVLNNEYNYQLFEDVLETTANYYGNRSNFLVYLREKISLLGISLESFVNRHILFINVKRHYVHYTIVG